MNPQSSVYVPPHQRTGSSSSVNQSRAQKSGWETQQGRNKGGRTTGGSRSDNVNNWRTGAGSQKNNNNNNNNRNTATTRPSTAEVATLPREQQPRVMKNKHNKPVVPPTSGPLFDFLERTDFSNFEETSLAREVMNLEEDLKFQNKWIYWLEPESATLSEPTREDFLQTLKVSRTYGSLQKLKAYALQSFQAENCSKICLFKQGVKPVWEDRTNFNGGRFYLACHSRQGAFNAFLVLVTKLLCGRYLPEREINGFVLKLVEGKYCVEIWNKNASEKDKIKLARKNIKKIFKKNVMYHVHRTSIKIVKYGIESVLPEIEKAEAEKQKKWEEKKEKEKEKQAAAPSEEAEPKSVIEEVNKALVKVALENAWKATGEQRSVDA